jgi:NAD(P)H-hydrate epimerase
MKLPLLPHDRVGVLPEVDLVVDGLLGSSIEGAPRSVESVLLDWANSRSAPRLALDLPSGLHPDSGEPGRPTLRADATLTLGLPKLGLREERAHDFVGELYLADISVPPELWRRIGVTVSPALFERAPVLRLEGAG